MIASQPKLPPATAMKTHHSHPQPRFPGLLFALLLGGILPLQARTIEWGNAVGDTVVTSTGIALDDSFIFELGSFGSFMPSESNLELWAANWKVFDRAVAPALEGWNSAAGFFSSAATMNAGGVSSESPPLPSFTFTPGEQAYIWVYNGLTIDALTEWALVTNNALDGNAADDWLFPAPGGKEDLPLEWRISGATRVPFGGLNDVEGPGDYSVTPPSFDLQTHAVPEPASALLLGIAGLLSLRRRRQHC